MQTEGLKIQIGYQVQNQAGAKKVATDLQKIGVAADRTSKQLNTTSTNSKKLRASFSGLNNIVRDAPYGINGVANNLTQLSDALFGASLAAQAAGLGISLIITGLVSLSQKYGSVGAAIDAVLNPLNEQARIQKTVNDTLQQGARDAQKEVVALEVLYQATQDVNVPMEERSKIVDELQSKYPSYLGNLSNEQILAGKGAIAYNKLREAILAAAQARAIQDKVAEISAKLLDIDTQRVAKTEKLQKAQAKINKNFTSALQSGAFSVNQAGTALDRAAAASLGSQIQISGLKSDISDLNNEERELTTTIDRLLAKQTQLIRQFGAVGSGVSFTTDTFKTAEKDLQDIGFRLLQTAQRVFPPIKPKIPVEMQLVGVAEAQKNLSAQLRPIANTLTKDIQTIEIDIEGALQNLAARMVSGISNAIGGIIGGAYNLREALGSIVTVFADFLSQLGEAMIASGVAIIAAEALSTNPFTAIAAGALAVTAAAAIKAAINKAPSFATGGTVFGTQLAVVGDNPARKEHILSDAQLDTIAGGNMREVRVYGILRGQDILLSNNRTAANLGRVN